MIQTFYTNRFAEVNGYSLRIGDLLSAFHDFSLDVRHDVPTVVSKHHKHGVFDLSFGAHSNAIKPLIVNLSFDLVQGTHVIISGSSGCGKTTLLKVIRGFWSPISGQILLPMDICFLPSEPYFVYDGSIRDQITYPEPGDLLSEADYQQIIRDCELEGIMDLYYENRSRQESSDWTLCLSSGERQRLAFCRLLWRKPSFAFLDEATVHIGMKMTERLFTKGMERGITFVILTHENLGPIFPNHREILLDQKVNHISFL